MRSLGIGFLLLAATGLFAQQPAQPYEHAVIGRTIQNGCNLVIEPIDRIELQWIGLIPSHATTDVAVVAPAPGGRVFAAINQGTGFFVAEIRPDGTRTPLTVAVGPLRHPQAMVVDQAGIIYVLTTFNTTGSAIIAFHPSGTVETIPLGSHFAPTVTANDRATAIDLAPDQCTLFMIQLGGPIKRFNLCTRSFIPDFVTIEPRHVQALRVLPDGGLLISMQVSPILQQYELRRYDSAGAFVRSYPLNDAALALMLRDGGTRLVYGESACALGRLVTMDLATGTIESDVRLNLDHPTSLVTYHGWTAALGSHHGATDVPVTGAVGLAILAALTLVVALMRLR